MNEKDLTRMIMLCVTLFFTGLLGVIYVLLEEFDLQNYIYLAICFVATMVYYIAYLSDRYLFAIIILVLLLIYDLYTTTIVCLKPDNTIFVVCTIIYAIIQAMLNIGLIAADD